MPALFNHIFCSHVRPRPLPGPFAAAVDAGSSHIGFEVLKSDFGFEGRVLGRGSVNGPNDAVRAYMLRVYTNRYNETMRLIAWYDYNIIY
jgi:hypothetical protein